MSIQVTITQYKNNIKCIKLLIICNPVINMLLLISRDIQLERQSTISTCLPIVIVKDL